MKLFAFLLLSSWPSLLAQAPAQPPKCPPPVGHIDITSAVYSSQPGVTFRLRHFSAALVPQASTAPFCYQKLTVVSHAEIFVSNESLTKVFSTKLTESESKIRDFKVVNSADGVTLSGTITKIIPIHFSISGPVTTDGMGLLLHAQKVKADGIPIKALLELVGQHLSAVLGMKNVSGVSVQEDTMTFLPEKIARLKGHIHSVKTSADGLTLTYTAGSHSARGTMPTSPAPDLPKQ